MAIEKVDTLVVGGGQAGIAASEHLCTHGISHVVLERDRIAEKWRSARWDSLVANGPAWHDRFPNREFDDPDHDAFIAKDAVADYFVDYVKQIKAPLRCGVEVTKATRIKNGGGFYVETTAGDFETRHIIAATGAFQVPVMPDLVPDTEGMTQLHSNDYRNPDQLPNGAVMVVGAGSSGAQIAEELMDAGRQVYLSVGPHDRPPRSYRGRDFCWWLGVLGKWDMQTPGPGTEHVTIAVSGAKGGRTVDFRRFAAGGMQLVGRTERYDGGKLHFADDLVRNVENGDANHRALLDEADAYIKRHGLDLPLDPEERARWPEPDCMKTPIKTLDLADAGITTIIWATGFSVDYGWLDVDTFDEHGKPVHSRGVSKEPGVYFLGLPWQSRRGSSFIWGVWHDAKFIADQIAIQHTYQSYRPSEARVSEPPAARMKKA
ncbi:NAD(P)/FAD-dependent oxidoreductase [Marivita sp. S6314]|uniref:flavin-containing monooxygenase n=1 Tax=Marivita sp. S6314 TaxID=2926406 RepID=UPI001FF216C3|nr:NAD(P)/FAD-dependent oxidoreductase [Marivita sp. S6314]MCK0150664.1 NAD(P)/FAD-dependent oxidoreductase [Marivita sp. S6314]